jgi:hypothetical protein
MIVGHPTKSVGASQSDFLDRQNVRCVFQSCSILHASAAVNRDTRRMTVAMAKTQQERAALRDSYDGTEQAFT